MPGAKVLGREMDRLPGSGRTLAVFAAAPARRTCGRDALQIVVHIARAHRVLPAVLVLVLEQLLARQLLAAAHHAGHARVGELGALLHAALAAKAQFQGAAAHVHMARAQRGQAKRLVGDRVFLVAHAHVGGVQQPHDGGQHLRARQRFLAPARRQVARQPGADARQRLAKGRHALELVGIAQAPPVGVVAVLAPAACVQPGGLQVAVGQRADPHIGVRGRNGQAADARQLVCVAQPVPVGLPVAKALAFAQALQARHVCADIDQPAWQPAARFKGICLVWQRRRRLGRGNRR